MEYLHTMVRVADLDASLAFYCDQLGLVETNRYENEKGRFTLVFLAAPGDVDKARENKAPLVELTYNWDPEDYGGGRNFGHLAYRVDNIYEICQKLICMKLFAAGIGNIQDFPAQWQNGLCRPVSCLFC